MKKDIKKIKAYISLLEKYTGKKVKFLKEADEASKNQAVNDLNFVQNSLTNCADKLNELFEIPVLTKERNILLNKVLTTLGTVSEDINSLIQQITSTTSQEQEGIIEEDVTMSTDEIIKNPDAVKKLSDKKVDIKVKDKNMKF